jgi:hypothetical protein
MKRHTYHVGLLAMVLFAGASYEPAIARNITRFYVQNDCPEVVDLVLEYIPVGGTRFRTTNYVFSPGENGYLVDTDNLYVYTTGSSRDTARRWSRKRVNVGENSGKFTHRLTCR